MVHKKKFLTGYYILLVTLLFLFLNMSCTCLAYMTSDYLDYGLETLKDTYVGGNSTSTTSRRTFITAFYNDSTAKLQLLQTFNNQLDTWGIPNISDRNIIGFMTWSSNGSPVFKLFVCNNTFPNGYEDLDFFLFNSSKINVYSNSTTDFIYQFSTELRLVNNSMTFVSFNTYILPTDGTSSSILINSPTFTTDTNTVLTGYNYFCCGLPGGFAYYPLSSTNSSNIIPIILKDANGNYQIPSPDPIPSGDNDSSSGTITNPSGDITGNIDLTGIENGLTNIQSQISGDSQKIINTISGETQKVINTLTDVPDLSGETISSEQITDNIDFGLINNNSTLNGFSNFWLDLTNGLRGALTGNVRSINIDFRDETYTINLDDFTIQLPPQLKFLLGMISTIYFIIIIIKWWKVIIDKITSGDIDEVLAMNEEERHCRFILGGV